MRLNVVYIFCFALVCTACEEILMGPAPDTDPLSIFDEAWEFVDREYSFFEFKEINWDQVYLDFRPQINPSMDEEALFDVLADMLFLLRDGHVNLTAPFDRSRNWEWYLNSPPNFNFTLLERNYFDREQQFVGPFTYKEFDDVAYFYYSSFGLRVEDRDIDYIIENARDKRGLIIDVRNNGGGSSNIASRIAGRFTEEEITVGAFRLKNGPGHDDFTELFSRVIKPEGDAKYTQPVVVLTNRRCYSATNDFVLLMRAIPTVTILGDTTGGGGGTPSYTELSNGWNLRVSSSQDFTIDTTQNGEVALFNVESGIPPDVRVDLSPSDEARGIDTILEAALRRLRE